MIVLYTTREGGEWIPFNTPVELAYLMTALRSPCAMGFIVQAEFNPLEIRYHYSVIPPDDSLPSFHSILLPTNARWDAFNQEWKFRVCDKTFQQWWTDYIREWKPNLEDRLIGAWGARMSWYDQGTGDTWEEIVNFKDHGYPRV